MNDNSDQTHLLMDMLSSRGQQNRDSYISRSSIARSGSPSHGSNYSPSAQVEFSSSTPWRKSNSSNRSTGTASGASNRKRAMDDGAEPSKMAHDDLDSCFKLLRPLNNHQGSMEDPETSTRSSQKYREWPPYISATETPLEQLARKTTKHTDCYSVRSFETSYEPFYGHWSPKVMRGLQDRFSLKLDHLEWIQNALVEAQIPLQRPFSLSYVNDRLKSWIKPILLKHMITEVLVSPAPTIDRNSFLLIPYPVKEQKMWNNSRPRFEVIRHMDTPPPSPGLQPVSSSKPKSDEYSGSADPAVLDRSIAYIDMNSASPARAALYEKSNDKKNPSERGESGKAVEASKSEISKSEDVEPKSLAQPIITTTIAQPIASSVQKHGLRLPLAKNNVVKIGAWDHMNRTNAVKETSEVEQPADDPPEPVVKIRMKERSATVPEDDHFFHDVVEKHGNHPLRRYDDVPDYDYAAEGPMFTNTRAAREDQPSTSRGFPQDEQPFASGPLASSQRPEIQKRSSDWWPVTTTPEARSPSSASSSTPRSRAVKIARAGDVNIMYSSAKDVRNQFMAAPPLPPPPPPAPEYPSGYGLQVPAGLPINRARVIAEDIQQCLHTREQLREAFYIAPVYFLNAATDPIHPLNYVRNEKMGHGFRYDGHRYHTVFQALTCKVLELMDDYPSADQLRTWREDEQIKIIPDFWFQTFPATYQSASPEVQERFVNIFRTGQFLQELHAIITERCRGSHRTRERLCHMPYCLLPWSDGNVLGAPNIGPINPLRDLLSPGTTDTILVGQHNTPSANWFCYTIMDVRERLLRENQFFNHPQGLRGYRRRWRHQNPGANSEPPWVELPPHTGPTHPAANRPADWTFGRPVRPRPPADPQ